MPREGGGKDRDLLDKTRKETSKLLLYPLEQSLEATAEVSVLLLMHAQLLALVWDHLRVVDSALANDFEREGVCVPRGIARLLVGDEDQNRWYMCEVYTLVALRQ